jgi:hypothetical protein
MAYSTEHAANELTFSSPIRRNDFGAKVKRVQEWLSLHNFSTTIDSDYGPATEQCVRDYQHAKQLSPTGIVDQATYTNLTEPLSNALREITPSENENIASLVMKYARQHLSEHPREVGGQNCGPWVRLYMDGNEGRDWPWCAGFVTFIIKQACEATGHPLPIPGSFDCWELARQAKENEIFVSEDSLNAATWSAEKLCPCSIFLVKDGSGHWSHTGFALGDQCSTTTSTIEGNTNDDGNAEGYEVCKRIRSLEGKDYVRLA